MDEIEELKIELEVQIRPAEECLNPLRRHTMNYGE
jgi:hypothetical protein